MPNPNRSKSDQKVTTPFPDRCMLGLPKERNSLVRLNEGYLRMTLAYTNQTKKQVIEEYCHKLVLLSKYGPPPTDEDYVAMHLCNNRNCLNADHIVWGLNRENWYRGKQYCWSTALARLSSQGRWNALKHPPTDSLYLGADMDFLNALAGILG